MPEPPGATRRIAPADIAAAALLAVAVLVRVAALAAPSLAETNYEEAEVGLMARSVLQGDFIALWWGVPYLGTVHVYLAGWLFALFGASTLVLRLVPLLLSLVGPVFTYGLARALLGPGWALVTLAWWALPPAYLTRLSLTPYNYVGSVGWGAAILYLTHRAVTRRPPSGRIFGLLGLFSGLALWDHLISLCFLAVSGLWLLGAALRRDGRPPVRAGWLWLGGLLLGSLPFWLWNATHGFETVTVLLWPGVGPRAPLAARVDSMVIFLADVLGRARDFWGHRTPGPPFGTLLAFVYVPAGACLLVGLAATGAQRLAGKPRPAWAPPAGTGLVVTAFVLACAQYVLSSHHGERYLMPVYATAPILLAASARTLAHRARWLAGLLAVLLVSVHVLDNVQLARVGAGQARRPVDEVIAFLLRQDLRYVYAHARVAWPMRFESSERLVVSDLRGYLGSRYLRRAGGGSYVAPYFKVMEMVDLAPRVAMVTHDGAGIPKAFELDSALRLLGGTHRRTQVGAYTVFWDFQPPSSRIQEIPPGSIALRASSGAEYASHAIDRNIATTWKSSETQVPGIVVEATLDRPRPLAKVLMDPGNLIRDYPRGVRIETSLDGAQWRERVAVAFHLGGMDWLGAHPKLNVKGRLAIWLDPVETRHVRITQIATTAEKVRWTIAELFLYEASPHPSTAEPARFVAADEWGAVQAQLRAGAVEAVYSTDEGHVFFARHLAAGFRTVTLRDRRDEPVQRSERVVHVARSNAFFLPAASPVLEEDFRAHGLAVVTHRFASGVLYVASGRSPSEPLYWAHGRLLRLAVPADRR
jgi:Dolichyl-phosphate-mannose-protein mannosyltransferase